MHYLHVQFVLQILQAPFWVCIFPWVLPLRLPCLKVEAHLSSSGVLSFSFSVFFALFRFLQGSSVDIEDTGCVVTKYLTNSETGGVFIDFSAHVYLSGSSHFVRYLKKCSGVSLQKTAQLLTRKANCLERQCYPDWWLHDTNEGKEIWFCWNAEEGESKTACNPGALKSGFII